MRRGLLAAARTVTLAAVLVCLAPVAPPVTPAVAQEQEAPEVPKALLRQEELARKRCADELLKLAKSCAMRRGFDAAREQLLRGLLVYPESTKLVAELERLEDQEGDPRHNFATDYEKKRADLHESCVDSLGKVARAYDKADLGAKFQELMELAEFVFPEIPAREHFGLKWFDPYLSWERPRNLERLEAGWEQVDGKWMGPDAVIRLNSRHADWKDPWVVSDEMHEIRTNMALRTARSVLAHAGAFRKFFLSYFEGEWDLETPKGKLPIILTDTQREYVARMKAYSGKEPPEQAAAFYIWTSGSLDPCFVTFEPRQIDGSVRRVDFTNVLIPLKHEIGHQLSYEYSKHLARNDRTNAFQHWAVEGVANFLPQYVVAGEEWKLTHTTKMPQPSGGFSVGPFAWCKANKDALVPIADFMKISKADFMSVENYHYAATLMYFLLEGRDRAYREATIRLLAAVHQIRDTEDLFDVCFEGVDQAVLQKEFLGFLDDLELDT